MSWVLWVIIIIIAVPIIAGVATLTPETLQSGDLSLWVKSILKYWQEVWQSVFG